MKNLKPIIIAGLLIITFGSINAQKLRFGVKGGFTLSTVTGIEYYDNSVTFDDLDYKPGFHIGAFGQFMFTEAMGIEAGLYYAQTGGEKSRKFGGSQKVKLDIKTSYIQLPVLFMYKFKLSPDFYLYPSSGLYFGYGVGDGKVKIKTSQPGNSEQTTSDFFGDDMRRFDIGFVFAANIQYKHLLASLSVEPGILHINKDTDLYYNYRHYDDKYRMYNNSFKLSIGYLF